MSTAPRGRGAGDRHVYRVSELLAGVRGLLDDRVGRVWIVGEVSNLRRAPSGHVYFTLKDDGAQLRAALFRGTASRLAFDPEDGLEVLVYGELTLYEARGDLQVIVLQLEPRGRGALQLAFEQRRARLEAEGLFDPARKRLLPIFPRRVGVVTSPRGAALRDVVHVTGHRFPATPLLLASTRVQGEGAEHEIAAALANLARHGEIDVVLLVRGGGSLEDLEAFNSEVVARAIVACPVPVVCGVGHEVDVTIADLAADARGATPSAAAALVVPDRRGIRDRLARDGRRLLGGIGHAVQSASYGLDQCREALRALAPSTRIAAQRQRLRAAAHALVRAVDGSIRSARAESLALAGRLDSLSPLAVLGRGYAIARRFDDGSILRGADQVRAGEGIRVRLGRGEIEATVDRTRLSERQRKVD